MEGDNATQLPPSNSSHSLIDFPFPISLGSHYQPYQPGQLHLSPCTIAQFTQLPVTNEDRYDLVDGLLVSQPDMGDVEHNIRDGVAELFRSTLRHIDRDGCFTVFTERSIDVSPAKASRPTIRRPDICIVDDTVEDERANRSPPSRRLTCPRGLVPLLCAEVTSSTTSATDKTNKWKEYAAAGIENYIIIDRDLPSRKNQRVIVGKLVQDRHGPPIKYAERTFKGADVVECAFLDQDDHKLKANDLLNPPRAKLTAHSPVQKEKNRADQAEAKERNERRERLKAEAKERNERRERLKAEEKADEERRKRLKLEARLRELEK